MAKYLIKGGNKLSGKISISGNKNSILPCLAATLLTDQEVTLENVPNISDVSVLLQILQGLGSKIRFEDQTITIQTPSIGSEKINEELSHQIRASILLVGPVLARSGKVEFFRPGGDLIGLRPLDAHFEGMKLLGVDFKIEDEHYLAKRKDKSNKEIFMDEASVTATENLIMLASLGDSEVVINNAACEPNVVDLCNMLNKMGAKISGVGSNSLKIKGVKKLNGTSFRIGPDYMEMGTYAVAAAITGGKITMENCSLVGLEPMTSHFEKMGLSFKETSEGVTVSSDKIIPHLPKLHSNIWPGFPTDLMSVAIVLATQASGTSLLHDWMYETRMVFVDKLINMGADATILDPHRVIVNGPTKLFGRYLDTPDIRAGMALVLASLVAEGESSINDVELIERGYANVVENLTKLGGVIQRVD